MSRLRWIFSLYLLLWLGVAGTAAAAEFVQQEIYIVPAGEVVTDDLYVSASEIVVDGRVEGDLVAIGSYVEVNGVVTGDLLAVAGGVRLDETAEIGDDVRLLTGSAAVAGRIGDDFVTTGSGNPAAPIPLQVGTRTVDLGIFVDEASIGGDAVLFGGLAELSGQIDGRLVGFVNSLFLHDLEIGGDAELTLSAFSADEASRVRGPRGFRYTAPEPLAVPATLSEEIEFTELVAEEQVGLNLLTLIRRIVGAIAGFALLGWLLLRFRPEWLLVPVLTLRLEPLKCLIVGFIVALGFLFVPVMTLLLMGSVGFFWGLGVALLTGGLVLCGLALLWAFSPLLVGLWVGGRFNRQPFGALLVGATVIVLLRQVPLLGFGLSAIVFMAAVGALVLMRPLERLPRQV